MQGLCGTSCLVRTLAYTVSSFVALLQGEALDVYHCMPRSYQALIERLSEKSVRVDIASRVRLKTFIN